MSGRRTKWGLILAGLLLIYTVGGCYVLPAVLKSQLEAKLPPILHRAVTVEAIAFNPFTLTLDITGFRATEPTGEAFLGFQRLLVNLQASSLLQRSLNFKEISLTRPSVGFTLHPDGTNNFSNIGPPPSNETTSAPPPTTEPAEPSKPLLIRIETLRLDEGQARFEDRSASRPYKTVIGPINFEVTNFKTDPDWSHPHRFLARMDPDTVLSWAGSFSVSPFWSEGKVELSGVHVPSFEPYYAERFRGHLLDGAVSLKFDYRLDTAGGRVDLQVHQGAVTLANLAVAEPAASLPVATLPLLALNDLALDLKQRTVTVGTLLLRDGTFAGVREKDGRLNVERLLPPADGASQAAPPAPAPTTPDADPAAHPWKVALGKAEISNFGISFVDQVPMQPARFTIDQLNVSLRDLHYPESTAMPADLSFLWNRDGSFAVSGSIRHTPLSAELDTTIKNIGLAAFQPYVGDALYVDLTSGHFDSSSHLVYGPPRTDGTPLRLHGDAALVRIAAKDSRTAELLAKFDALRVSGADIQTLPTRIAVDQIHLKNFLGQASTTKDGGVNLASLQRTKPAPAPDPAAGAPATETTPSEPLALTVRSIVIDNAGVSFVDRTLEPALSTGINQLTGRIQNISYPQPAKTLVDLTAKADSRAPLRINGQLEPKGKDSLVDLLLSLKGYDVPVFTGYSSKYVGYPIQKGKLSLDLKYGVANRKLTGENAVLVDQLTLGPKSDSPDATSLPVKLALAILTDRKGQIHLDVPVGGSLDDPEFTLGRVILRALLNILEKVATSPFALLGAVAGGGGDAPNTVDFLAGSATLTEPEVAKLAKLAAALNDRPALTVEVSASVDPQADRLALAKDKVRRLLQQKKRAATAGKGANAGAAEDIALDEAEYERMLRDLYTSMVAVERTAQPGTTVALEALPPPPTPETGFWAFLKRLNPFGKSAASQPGASENATTTPAPNDTQTSTGGAPSALPFAEMEAAILAKQPVGGEELAQLRKARTDAVVNYLAEQGQLGPNRVFAASTQSGSTTAASSQASLTLN